MSGDPYYEPTAAPAPSPRMAGSPATAPNPALAPSPARYVYLIGRLRGRQITMEEATELFQIQQQMVARAQAIANATAAAAAPIPPPPPAAGAPKAAPRTASTTAAAGTDDLLWESLPVLAAGAGILAAVLKRAQEGPRPAPASKAEAASEGATAPSPASSSDPPGRTSRERSRGR